MEKMQKVNMLIYSILTFCYVDKNGDVLKVYFLTISLYLLQKCLFPLLCFAYLFCNYRQ